MLFCYVVLLCHLGWFVNGNVIPMNYQVLSLNYMALPFWLQSPYSGYSLYEYGTMSESLLIICPHCQIQNRVPVPRLSEKPNCGQCHRTLFTGHPLALDAATFDRHLNKSDLPLLVDFWASWCGPCKMMAPQFEQAAKTLEPRVRLAKVNTESEQGLAGRFGIRSIPTLKLFHHGKELASQAGAMDVSGIVRWAGNFIK